MNEGNNDECTILNKILKPVIWPDKISIELHFVLYICDNKW